MKERFSGSSDQFNFTKHALARMDERKIPRKDVLLVLHFGKKVPDEEGCFLYYLPFDCVAAYWMKELYQRLIDIRVVVTGGNCIITVYKKDWT